MNNKAKKLAKKQKLAEVVALPVLEAVKATKPVEPKLGMRLRPEAVGAAKGYMQSGDIPVKLYTTHTRTLADARAFTPAKPPPGVVPEGAAKVAMDDALSFATGQMAGFSNLGGEYGEGLHWLGFPYLAELTQRGEYRRIVETMAREMTRSWITVKKKGKEDTDERVDVINKQLVKHKIQDKFRRIAELDGYYGRAHLFIDMGISVEDPELLKTALILDKRLFEKGSLENIKVVEPTWTYPGQYNSSNPLARDFYFPNTWYVMSREIHRTRLLTFVSREMPDLLKPAYSFGGLSMSQMAKPYVDNWLRTQQSVSDLIHSFSVSVLATDMSSALQEGGGEQEAMRAALFNAYRDNRGLFMINKETEEFSNVSTSLGTLDHLQAQAQEHVCSITGEPLVVYTGITPSGLNASSEGELQVWAQTVKAMQEHLFHDHLTTCINAIQMDQFGDIDSTIYFDFNPLKEESDEEAGTRRKSEADAHAAYVTMGALGPDEVREVLASDEDSPYSGLDLSGPPPTPPEMEPDPLGGGPSGGGGAFGGAFGGGPSAPPRKPLKPGDPRVVRDAAEGDTIDEIAKAISGLAHDGMFDDMSHGEWVDSLEGDKRDDVLRQLLQQVAKLPDEHQAGFQGIVEAAMPEADATPVNDD